MKPSPGEAGSAALTDSLREIEGANGPVKTLPRHYAAGHRVEKHSHSRAQLLYASRGVVVVSATEGRWIIPPEHALWIPPGIEHSVEMLVDVDMLSLYMAPDAVPALPERLRVVGVSSLAHELIVAAVEPSPEEDGVGRMALLMPLLLDVVTRLPERPLGLPLPAEPRLAALCRHYLANPSPDLAIKQWADAMSVSRRSFTRLFRRQTGLSLSAWRQQACVFSAMPRLAAGEAVTSVALDLGYDSIGAFITMFRRVMGTSPRAYLNARGRRQSSQ